MSVAQVAEQVPQPITADYLARAIEYVRPRLDRETPLNDRVRIFWAAVVAAKNLAAADVVQAEFNQLAIDVGIFADLGRHADQTVAHLIRWGLFARNPFR